MTKADASLALGMTRRAVRWVGVVAIVGLTAAVCNNPAQSRGAGGGIHPSTGLTGTVTRWPVAPVCQENVPCDGPYTATFAVMRDGHRVTTFQTDSAGRFSVSLEPGSYTIVPTDNAFMGQQSKDVTVQPQGMTEVQLRFDTGIR